MQLASSLFSAATSESSSPSGSAGRFADGLVTENVARAVVSATGCRVADVSMVMLLALLESSRAGCGREAGALEAVATGAGLLTGAIAGAFAGLIGAGAGAETATAGFDRGASGAEAIARFGCGAGALYATGAGAGCSTITGALGLEAEFEFFAITAVVAGGGAAATGVGATAPGATATDESATVVCGAG